MFISPCGHRLPQSTATIVQQHGRSIPWRAPASVLAQAAWINWRPHSSCALPMSTISDPRSRSTRPWHNNVMSEFIMAAVGVSRNLESPSSRLRCRYYPRTMRPTTRRAYTGAWRSIPRGTNAIRKGRSDARLRMSQGRRVPLCPPLRSTPHKTIRTHRPLYHRAVATSPTGNHSDQ